MPDNGKEFTSEELAAVLSHYNIGIIQQAQVLRMGNTQAPKSIILTDAGRFLLKRRPRGKDDPYHVSFSHEIQTLLQNNGFPVPGLVQTRDSETCLYYENHVYELFHFARGGRYDGSLEGAADAGRKLAEFHKVLHGYSSEWMPLKSTYHDSPAVRRHLKVLASKSSPLVSDDFIRNTAVKLTTHYNECSTQVNALGFDSWENGIVHSDWHPGNMLFSGSRVSAVVDFDSAKVAPPVCDIGNGMLQFSIIAGKADPTQWPSHIDQDRMLAFVGGYREVSELSTQQREALPYLMVETMIAESVLPIATTGFFYHLSGIDFLKMILRKCNWIFEHYEQLNTAMCN